MAEYFVDIKDGDDSNSGLSERLAWKTLTKINGFTFASEDIIQLAGGREWRGETLIVPRSELIFRSYGSSKKPMINGSVLVTGWADIGSDRWTTTVATDPNTVIFDRVHGNEVASQAAVILENDWFWETTAGGRLTVYSIGDPDTQFGFPGIEVGSQTNCIDPAGFTDITYKDLDLRYARTRGIESSEDGANLTRVHIIGTGTIGVNVNAFGFTMTDCLVQRCNRHTGSNAAINIGSTSGDIMLRNVEVDSCGVAGVQMVNFFTGFVRVIGGRYHGMDHTNDGDGLRLPSDHPDVIVSGAEFYDNFANTNQGDGIQVSDSLGVIIEHCHFHDNSQGLALTPSKGATVRYNIFENNIRGFANSNSSTAPLKVYGNTFVGNGDGDGGGGGSALAIQTDVLPATADIIVRNNIFVKNNVNILLEIRHSTFLALDNNRYWDTIGSGDIIDYVGSGYTLAQFASYQSTESQDAHSLAEDPLFVDASVGNFRLRQDSPCRETGLNLNDRVSQYALSPESKWPNLVKPEDQNIHGRAWDIGAFLVLNRQSQPPGRKKNRRR